MVLTVMRSEGWEAIGAEDSSHCLSRDAKGRLVCQIRPFCAGLDAFRSGRGHLWTSKSSLVEEPLIS